MADWSLPRKPRKSNFSTDEVDVLVDSVKSHYNVLYGKYAKRATNRWIRQKAWMDILKKVNGVSIEKRTLQEVKNKWKKCQYALKEKVSKGALADDLDDSSWEDMAPPSMRRKNRYTRHLYNAYDLDLKKSVVIFAEENGNKEAQARYGISEANIRRWRRLKNDIFGKPHDYDRGKLRSRKRVNYSLKVEKVSCDSVEQESQSSVDSMPLQERLSKVAAQEKMGTAGPLKSQPLSPTKLKVTRQSPKTKHVEPPKSPVNEEMCLRWNSHHSNMQTAFPTILSKEQYVDVTLAAEGKTLKCHRLILSSCSPYFEEILSGISPFQHPVLFMRDIPFWILKSLCDFMYAGEVHIFQNKLEELLTVAEALKIKGLAGKSTPPGNQEEHPHKNENNSNNNNNNTSSNIKEKKKQTEKEKTQQIPPLKKNPIFAQANNFESTSQEYEDDLLDPLDLLEPLYEEAAEEKKPASTLVKPKENKYQYQPMKKPFTRRLRKRKYSEQREPSPPPVFSFRKGTRSRPNVKIPKYYHSDYSNPIKPTTNAQTDPLLDVDEIKTEPIDVEDNQITYSDEDHYIENSVEPANCDSPIIITSTKSASSLPPQPDKFKKIKLSKPIITEVHTIEESNTTAGGLEVIKITVQQQEDKKSQEGDLLQGIVREDMGGVQESVTMETEEAPMESMSAETAVEGSETEKAAAGAETVEGVGESGTEETANEIPVPGIKIAEVTTVEEEEEEQEVSQEKQREELEDTEDDRQVDQPVKETEQQVEENVPQVKEVSQQEEQIEGPDEILHEEMIPHQEEVPRQNELPQLGEVLQQEEMSQQQEEVSPQHEEVQHEQEEVQQQEKEVSQLEEMIQEEPQGTMDQPDDVSHQEEVNAHVDEGHHQMQEVDEADMPPNVDPETDQLDQQMDEINQLDEDAIEQIDQLQRVEQQLEDDDQQGGLTSLDHLEKEAMNVVNVINMENQAGPPDIE